MVALLAAARPGVALSPNLSLSQFQQTTWAVKQGAPTDIWALAQSPEGFLLLGTGAGLYRFDGITFERVVPSNQPDLGFRDITALLALPSGELWIGYYAGGVSELKNGVLTSYDLSAGLPSGWVTSFAQQSDGTLWVAAREGLGRFSAGHWATVSADWNYRGHAAHWVVVDRQETLWVAGGETVVFLPRGSHRFEDTGIRSGYKSTLAVAPDGTVWLAGESVSPRALAPAQSVPSHSTARLDPVKRLIVDRDGSIWATDALRGGIYRATQHSTGADAAKHIVDPPESFAEAQGLPSDLAVPLLEDREGNIWVGTNLGLNRFRATHFVPEWCIPSKSRTGYSLAAAPDGSVWIAADDQLFEVRGSHCDLITRFPSPIRSAYLDPGGALWLGTHEGLAEWVNSEVKSLPLPAPAEPIEYQYVHAMTFDASHTLWVAAIDRGLLALHDGHWVRPGPGLHLPETSPTALWTDTAGRQWLGYADGSAALRTAEGTRLFGPAGGLQVGPILVIRGSPGEMLVGGEWGLARFDEQKFQSLSASRSDAFSGISGIIVRANGDIWLNGNRGVMHMSADALNDAYDHPLTKPRYDLFDIQDGLPGYAQQGEDASAVAAADGRLWFATNHGVAWIDPARLITNRIPPQVVIRSVLADQRAYLGPGPIELLEPTHSVRIDYTAPSLAAPERVRFRYKLDGADDTWRDAGNERSVRYANLPPGHYAFRVIASNGDGVWNEVGAAITFALRPAFYQTSWFRVLASAAFLGILWLLGWARVSQVTRRERKRLEQRMEGRLSERTRVARELHDTLLQSLQGLLLRFQVAYELLPARPAEAKQDLGSAIDRTVEAITEGRAAVQGLRAVAVDSTDLVTAIKTLAEELASDHYGARVVFRVDLQGTPRPLRPVARDEIFRIAAEALRNSRQHAQASAIEVELRYDERELRLRVRDNGKGIDPKFLNGEGLRGHYGLAGMRERAKVLGGQLSIWTAPASGAEIELTVPAARVYVATPANRLAWLLRLIPWKSTEVVHD